MVNVADHLTLPNPKQISFAGKGCTPPELQAESTKQVLREQCSKLQHVMLWEVAQKDDFVPLDDFYKGATGKGPAWFLVHTFLSSAFFPDFTEHWCNGLLNLFSAFTTWKIAIENKGMSFDESHQWWLRILTRIHPLSHT